MARKLQLLYFFYTILSSTQFLKVICEGSETDICMPRPVMPNLVPSSVFSGVCFHLPYSKKSSLNQGALEESPGSITFVYARKQLPSLSL